MILVDSDILIAHLRGIPAAGAWLEGIRTQGPLAVSVVSVTEITGGMRSVERREVWQLLASLHQVPVSPAIAQRAGELMRRYRRSHSGISLGDYLIAASADVESMELATLNIRHFPMFENLEPPFSAG